MLRTVLLVLASGCSYLLVPQAGSPRCTTSRAAPIVDTVVATVATAALLTGIVVLGHCPSEGENAPCLAFASVLMVPGFVLAAGYGSSAAVGFDRAGRCADLRAATGPN